MPHLVALSQVWQMLDLCAPGFTRRATKHHWIITWNGHTYRALPLGPHGRRVDPDIEIGHVRSMARHIGILDCAKRHLDLT